MIYGVKTNTCGVYQIRNKINNKSYVGSSKNVSARFRNHLNRDAKKYYWRDFYKDVLKYGKINFECILLEECSESELIEREQYYYDKIKPEYNIVRPCYEILKNKMVRHLALNSDKNKIAIDRRKDLYKTDYYRNLFSTIQNKRKKPVIMLKNNTVVMEFESLSDAGRYIDSLNKYKGKNKISKIKAVCDGKRKTAYGYLFKYKCNDYSERK